MQLICRRLATAVTALFGAAILALPAAAEPFRTVTDRAEFLSIVGNRSLQIPVWGIDLQVLPNGQIQGRGAGRPVSGAWKWSGAYFCRDLSWGERDLGANCQQVAINGSKVRFTSDRGTGRSADFRLR